MSDVESPDGDHSTMLKQCIERVASKQDKEAFTTLFEYFAPKLKAYSLAAQPGAYLLADELAQEVMVKVWTKAHTFNPEKASLSTWVFTLARNSRIDYFRKNGRFLSNMDPDIIFQDMVDDTPSPFSNSYNDSLESRIKEGLKQLPQEQSQTIYKVFIEGKTHQEAADELYVPLGTIKSRIRLSLQKLQVLMESFV